MSYRAFLGLGSNKGERQKYLSDAAGKLKGVPETKVVWTSSVYEADPFGKRDQAPFLNAVVEIETALEPDQLLEKCKSIEQTLGRTSTEKWGPREIDIDILIYDGVVFGNSTLRVPHPELEKRKFVLVPLKEIAPDLIHPESGMTITELADACRDSSRVVRSHHRILL